MRDTLRRAALVIGDRPIWKGTIDDTSETGAEFRLAERTLPANREECVRVKDSRPRGSPFRNSASETRSVERVARPLVNRGLRVRTCRMRAIDSATRAM